MKKSKILKLKDFVTLQIILIVKDSLTNRGKIKFNNTFNNQKLHMVKIQDQLEPTSSKKAILKVKNMDNFQ